ncbi:unnamed protein product [Peniophora sp. CBMAI 1063]|nr:unnamed protein product [Peniophora sp. CBMAI 1063]
MAPKVPTMIPVHSAEDVTRHLTDLVPGLTITETEDSWEKISVALQHLTALSAGGACDYPTAVIPFLKTHSRPFTSALSSERSRLSAAASEALSALASGLGPDFEPLVQLYFPPLIQLTARPNKVFVSRAKAAIHVLIEQTQLPALLRPLCEVLRDKSVTMRLIALEGVLACVNSLNPPELEKDVRAGLIEGAIKATATDAAADVRKVARSVFEAYSVLLPARVPAFTSGLDPTTRKYLNVTSSAAPSRPASQASIRSRPASSLAHHAPPRPATSMSTRSLTASGSSASIPSKKDKDVKEKAVPLARSMTDVTLSAKEKEKEKTQVKEKVVEKVRDKAAVPPRRALANDMPPPQTIPARRPAPQASSSSTSMAHRREPDRPHAAAPPLSRSGSAPVRPDAHVRPEPTALVRPEMSSGPRSATATSTTSMPTTATGQSTREKLMGSAGARRAVAQIGVDEKKSAADEKERKIATQAVAGPSTNATTRQRTKSRPPPFKPSTTTTASTGATSKAPPSTAPATKSTFAAPTASSARAGPATTKPGPPNPPPATLKPLPASSKAAHPAPTAPRFGPTKTAPPLSKAASTSSIASKSGLAKPVSSSRIPPAVKPPGYAPAPSEPKKRADPTQPTLSQLARMNANAASKSSASTKASAATKAGNTRPLALRNKAKAAFVPTKRGAVKEDVKDAKKDVGTKKEKKEMKEVKVEEAAEVPLPKTPDAVDVPLPKTPEAVDVPLPEAEEEDDVKEEDVEVEELEEEVEVPEVEIEHADEESDTAATEAIVESTPSSPHDTQPNSPSTAGPALPAASDAATPLRTHSFPAPDPSTGKTPISSLVAAIQAGFLPTPGGPHVLSPPANYAAPGETWNGWPAGMGAFAQDLTPRGNRVNAEEGVGEGMGDETMDMSLCGEGWKVGIVGMPGYEGYEEEGSRVVLGEMGIN